MKVEIWSDIRCPFCYIGKRKFEMALDQFPHKDRVEVIWRSFELDPTLATDPEADVYDYLAERKGMSRQASVQMHDQVVRTAAEVGLTYNFDRAVIANSFNAHRLLQLAKTQGLGDAAEERIFRAYFTEGRNIDDRDTLLELGVEIGLQAEAVADLLAGDAFAQEVRREEAQAQALGIWGVPFFVFHGKYGVSGAQAPETFLQALGQVWGEYEKENGITTLAGADGDACGPDGCAI